MQIRPLCCLVILSLVASAYGAAPAETKASAVRQIEWDDLLPPDERENLTTEPPAPVHDYLGEGGMAAMQSGSFDVNLSLKDLVVKLPGFIVPLEISRDGVVTQFFLVPYFGACVHVPPPPPNQIVYVKSKAGIRLDSVYEPQWITGRLRTEQKASRLGTAAYTLEGDKVEPYKY